MKVTKFSWKVFEFVLFKKSSNSKKINCNKFLKIYRKNLKDHFTFYDILSSEYRDHKANDVLS